MPKLSGLTLKLKKTYLKLLKASCKHKWDKARQLHAKIIGLQLELRSLEKEIREKDDDK